MRDDTSRLSLNGELKDKIVAWIGQERPPEIEDGVRLGDAADVVQDIIDVRERDAECSRLPLGDGLVLEDEGDGETESERVAVKSLQ